MFSEQIFEAIVVDVFYADGVCSLSPLSANSNSTITDVPIPHFAGNGNAGIFIGLKKGTRVIAMYTSSRGRESVVISGLIPKSNLYPKIFSQGKASDVPSGTIAYPEVVDGRLIIRGDRGSAVSLLETGDIHLNTVGGRGAYLKRNDNRAAYTIVSEDIQKYSSGGREFSGPARRSTGIQRSLFPKPDINEIPLFADPKFSNRTESIGFFTGSLPLKRSFSKRKRNPELSEYKMTINEFSTDYMFTGFDDEVARYKNEIELFDSSETSPRFREPTNSLYLAEHELIEIIGGNLIDISGNVLDINYRAISYGGDNNRIPISEGNIDISFDRARRISRRGVGYHFQLSTNTRSDDISSSTAGLIMDIDKEGLLKVNIPASSDTGNIPFGSNAIFNGANDTIEVLYLNPSVQEAVPVTLRDENGEIVFPSKKSDGIEFRSTGIRYSTSESSPYFPSGAERVNSTKYHNMYAAAERLIANTISVINIPQFFTDADGFPEGISVGKPFEVPIPDSYNSEENSDDPSAFREILGIGKTDFPSYMSVIAVNPGVPAVDPGGETVVAGINYDNDFDHPPFSNSFTSSITGNEIIAEEIASGTGATKNKKIGGKSAHMNFEGSIETSVGSDNFDRKSLTLDTEGSFISWLGKDKNNRSMVMQTDGDVLFNIGGTYSGTDAQTNDMNVGRFELRVNVVDKKFVTTQFTDDIPENGGNPRAESDYIISISENGIVIAGMKVGTPMILRNDGPILIESASSTVTLKGMEVKTVEPKGRAKSPRSSGR